MSGLAWHLEADTYMGKLEQFEECGENDPKRWRPFQRRISELA